MRGVQFAVQDRWPLVGRDAELAEILAARADPACPAVVLSAAAGLGKSRLAREACASAEVDGTPTLWAQATASSATIPLGAFAGLIPDDVGSDDRLDLVRRSSVALRAAGAGHSVLLAVDDAQLLDPASASVVLQLAATPEVFVLATIRTGERAPDAVDALWKDAGAHRIELERISDEAVAELVEAGLGGPVEQATMTQIADSCRGNPLYVRELVIGAIEDGRMRQKRGLWRIDGRSAVTPSLTTLIKRRIGALPPDLRAPLELLALGEPLRVHELAGLTSFEGVEAADERGLIAISGPSDDAGVGLGHPLYGEVIRVEMPLLRARGHRLRLAETIQRRRPLTPDDALRAARWLIDAGAEIPPELLLDAADAANLAGDPALGAELATRAIDAGAGLRAVLLLARAHIIRNRFAEADAVLAAAESSAPGDPEMLQYFVQRTHVLYWGLRQTNQAQTFLTRAEAWSHDPRWQMRMEPWRVAMAGFAEGFAGQLARIRDELVRPDLDQRTRYAMEQLLIRALMAGGSVREAETLVRRLRPRPPLRNNLDAYTLLDACIVGEQSGEDWPGLQEYMKLTLKEAVRIGDHEAAGLAAFTLGSLDFQAGRYRDGGRWLAEAQTQLELQDTFHTIACIEALQAGIACYTGDPATAQAAMASARMRMTQRPPRPTELVYQACAEGWAARARGEAAGVQAFMQSAAGSLDPSPRSWLLHEALRAGARPAVIAGELADLSASCDSRMIDARAAHAIALAEHDGAALLRAGEELAAIGCVASAVEAIAAGARQFLNEARLDSARRAAARARELHPLDQGWEMPVIDGLEGVAVELTAREAQIAALAARGLTNQQIADQLVLSVRTVETYVYRAMQKRGVDNRRELAG
ncbi:MAG TPA: LuxR C-terminal-related transcriptional regulator [Solirubrobacteraceae bacterium]|nr:LuxR C-terminal-related transcriptional regulator [Solirubrobacteraceae bacterium]